MEPHLLTLLLYPNLFLFKLKNIKLKFHCPLCTLFWKVIIFTETKFRESVTFCEDSSSSSTTTTSIENL